MSVPPHPGPEPAWRASAPSLLLAVLALAAGAGGEPARLALRWQRDALLAEPWRLVTGHLVHLGPGHLALNVLALALLGWIAHDARSRALASVRGAVNLLLLLAGSGLGLVVFAPALDWYVGLSGVLHGMLVVLAIEFLRAPAMRAWGLAVLAVIGAKLVWESAAGPLPFTEGVAGGPVAVVAHRVGVLVGVLVGGANLALDLARSRAGARV